MDELIHQVIQGYEIQEIAGKNSTGVAYRAYRSDLDQSIIVKFLSPEITKQNDFGEQFTRKISTLTTLDHPNVVKVRDFGQKDGHYYLIRDFIEGPSLRQLIREHKNGMPLWDVAQIFAQVADGLAYAHAQGIFHGDLKPENILLGKGMEENVPYQAWVMELGSLQLVTHNAEQIPLGTPMYMSPEQCAGETWDSLSDIFSMGVLLYEALIGKQLYPIRTVFDALRFYQMERVVSLRPYLTQIPPAMDSLVRQMLMVKREKRLGSAGTIAQNLRQMIHTLEDKQGKPDSQIQMRVDEVQVGFLKMSDTQSIPVGPRFVIHVAYNGIWDGKVYPIGAKPLQIGRQLSSDIILVGSERFVSKRHCEVYQQGRKIYVMDQNSTNGTFLDEQKAIPHQPYEWAESCVLHLGPFDLTLHQGNTEELALMGGDTVAMEPLNSLPVIVLSCPRAYPEQLVLGDTPVTLGRAIDCNMVLSHPHVSKYHCRVQKTSAGIEMIDLDSTNGSYFQGNRLPPQTPVLWSTATPLIIGPFTITLQINRPSS